MNLHLAEISKRVAPGAHAVLMLDQAGWHMTAKLEVPENITILPLPAKCPERLMPLAPVRSTVTGADFRAVGGVKI